MKVSTMFAVLIAAMLVTPQLLAHGGENVSVEALLSEVPGDLSGKRISMVQVTYPPGVSFNAHRHPGTVLVYVAAGEIRSQLGTDAEPVTYKAGDVWFEPPGARHVHSENPSSTEDAVLIAVLVGDEGVELVLPDED